MSRCLPLPESMGANVWTLARRELRESLRSRWFLLHTGVFMLLGIAVSFLSASTAGGGGLAGFGRTSAGLANLVTLVVPLMALTAGAGCVASERERGMLAFLLSQPISRFEVIAGKWLGLALALTASICFGFGSCALVISLEGSSERAISMVQLACLSLFLAVGMLGVGVLISVLSPRMSMATGLAIFAWLLFAFVSDLGLMAGTIVWKVSIQSLFVACMVNPLQAFKIWSLDGSGIPLDVLGPVGQYATDHFPRALPWFAAASLSVWGFAPIALAALCFTRRPRP